MAIPAHLWLTDETGSPIKGSSQVLRREGSIEVLRFSHGVHNPSDAHTGKLLGTRNHSPIRIEKEFDRSSPYLYRAVAAGSPLRAAELKWYRVDEAGNEQEYFIMTMENVRVVAVAPLMHHVKDRDKAEYNHLEVVELRYQKITWQHCDGNVQFSDDWRSFY